MLPPSIVFRFELQPSSATPLYRQIVEQVTRAVAAGALRDGDELPSVRAVAQNYVINPMTVSKAYSLLETQGLLERRRGMGMAVRRRSELPVADRLDLLRPALDNLVNVASQLGLRPEATLDALRRALDSRVPAADESAGELRTSAGATNEIRED